MMENKEQSKRVPKRRFKDFENDSGWDRCELGEKAEIIAGGDIDKSKIKGYGRYPVIANALNNAGIVGYYEDSYRVEGPAVTVTGRGDVGYAKARNYNFTPVVRLLSLKSEFDTIFLENSINNHNVFVESTGVPQLTIPQLGKYKILFPKLEEQIRIGEFFQSLNQTITLQQQKLEKLKAMKSAYLSEMFPAEGERKPKRRFPGFTEDWEQRELGESVKFINGRAYKQSELLDQGKYRVLRVGNFNTNDKWYYSDLELNEDKYANEGDLLYLWATAFGPKIWENERIIYHYHIWKVQINDYEIDKQYLYIWLENDKELIQKNTNGSTMVHITKAFIEERIFQFPSDIEEQKQIGIFFKNLDQTITLQQEKLEKLQNIKRAYLNEMFI